MRIGSHFTNLVRQNYKQQSFRAHFECISYGIHRGDQGDMHEMHEYKLVADRGDDIYSLKRMADKFERENSSHDEDGNSVDYICKKIEINR